MVRSAPDGPTLVLRAPDAASAAALREVAAQAAAAAAVRPQDAAQPPVGGQQGSSHFDSKTDKGSADLYFHYYGCLQHQQNMLQDYIRTGGAGGEPET
jgi:histone-arginine methyltransferase CARM1